jgi:AraC-like DNA-binding protein
MTNLYGQNCLIGTVRQLIINKPGLTCEQLAMQFCISPRTLHRKLSKEGTSFKKIHNEVRLGIAVKYLQKSDLAIKEVAYILGFSDVSSFYRFFNRGHQQSPRECRRAFSSLLVS